eukprot:9104025-Pyramimonas_sp.AAC.1
MATKLTQVLIMPSGKSTALSLVSDAIESRKEECPMRFGLAPSFGAHKPGDLRQWTVMEIFRVDAHSLPWAV